MKKTAILSICLFHAFISGCASTGKYPISDHYDGEYFFNPTGNENHGVWKTIKLLFTISFKDWPKRVENKRALSLETPLNENQVSITFINHSTFLIRANGINILTDPVWAERVSPVSWAGPKRVREPGMSIDELPPIHIVMVSHNHYDHMDLPSLKALNKKFSPRFLVPLGDKKLLLSEGIENVFEMDWWQKEDASSEVSVTFAPTQHSSARGLFDRNKSLWGSCMINFNGKLVYFGGDAAYSAHYRTIKEQLGAPDIALLPIGAYEPRYFMKVVHMNPADAVQAHIDLASKQSIGIHFGTFQQTEEEIDAPPRALEKAMLEAKLDLASFAVPKEGVTQIYTVKNANE